MTTLPGPRTGTQDPRRPDPKKKPEDWYEFWEGELKQHCSSRPLNLEVIAKVCHNIFILGPKETQISEMLML
jgi:hypothetical protein